MGTGNETGFMLIISATELYYHPHRSTQEMRFFLFFLIWFSVLGLAYFYVGRRLIKPARLEGRAKRLAWLGTAFWFLLPIVPFLFFLNGVQSTTVDLVSWGGYVALGLFSLVFTFVLIRDAVLVIRSGGKRIANLIRRRSGQETNATDIERRRFLLYSTNIGIVGGAAVLTGYGVYESHKRADVEEVDIPLENLPPEFDGFRIVQFSDIHVGPTIKRRFVEGIAEQVDGLKADCLVFTGDLVDGSVSWLRDDVAPLKDLVAPFGKFFITGNHEYYSGAMPWIEEAGRLGFDVLLNEHRIVQHGEGRIILAGVTDYGAGDFIPEQTSNPAMALANAPTGVVRILLAHQPRSIFEAARVGIDLQLSGHTHGGQFFPWNYLATLSQPYIKGLHRYDKTWVYVNRGTGYWGPPLRLGIPPEITVIKLVRK